MKSLNEKNVDVPWFEGIKLLTKAWTSQLLFSPWQVVQD